MFQNNPLLTQLKQKLHAKAPRVKGVVKATRKGFGFLEVEAQKKYFIPPLQMKKVMHGDRVLAALLSEKERITAEPETLIEPLLTRFVGKIHKRNNKLSIIPDSTLLNNPIPCRPAPEIKQNFREGDWAVAEMRHHPLKGDNSFYAELTQFITYEDDHFLPWWVTLARYNLEKEPPPDSMINPILDEGFERRDLTALDFITIDGANTEDLDDALYVEEGSNGKLHLTVAIADPTAWIVEGSKVDEFAKARAFSNYLPSFHIPMLPQKLSSNLCSLRPNEIRPALACCMTILPDGSIEENIEFFAATIESKAKLTYDSVSDWLENTGNWKPKNKSIATQIRRLYRLCLSRGEWRGIHAFVFKNQPEYRFVLDEKGKVLNVTAAPHRIANRIVEESMIAANICAARILRDRLGFGIYNVHTGFNPDKTEELTGILKKHNVFVDPKEILTLSGFCKLRRELDAQPSGFLNNCIRRFQSFAEIKTEPGPHFGLGLEAYATWTSPIRKYGDIINHRLLKAIMKGKSIDRPQKKTTIRIAERRRLNRMAKRDVSEWLYARFLTDKAGTKIRFAAEIIDISRSGMRVRLIDNGAMAYVPSSLLHKVRDELFFSSENSSVQIKGGAIYRVTDVIDIIISEVRMESRSIIARPYLSI